MVLVDESEYRLQDEAACMDPTTIGFEAQGEKIYRLMLNGGSALHAIMNAVGPAIDRAAQANALVEEMLTRPRPAIEYRIERDNNGKYNVVMRREDQDNVFVLTVGEFNARDTAAQAQKVLTQHVQIDNDDWNAAQNHIEAKIRSRRTGYEIVLIPEDGVGVNVKGIVVQEGEVKVRAARINQMIEARIKHGNARLAGLAQMQANYEGFGAW